jgi:outer membrane receptor protein involved in Fe transport
VVFRSIDQNFPQRSYSGEIQHLFRSRYINLVGGAGYFYFNAEQDLITVSRRTGAIAFSQFSEDVNHTNLYLYSYVNFPKNVTVTLGASGDFFHTDSPATESRNQFNPKVGVTWNPFPATTVRAAAFRVLKRTLITDQTLEPTQVAGFNQFFDDINSTESWRYGLAVDQKFPPNLYGGVELSTRGLVVPFQLSTPTGTQIQRADWNEYLGRAYLFWTPHEWVALGAEYEYARFTRDKELAPRFKEVSTQRVPLGLRFFHPSGVSAALRATYFHQEGDFRRLLTGVFESGDDDFWVVDAALSYRLPKRYGFLTVGATNLFDQHFRYQETDLRNSSIQPTRTVFGRITLALP